MRIYKEKEIQIPIDLNLTELLHQNAGNIPLPESHLIATDSLTYRSLTLGQLRDRAGRIANGLYKSFRPSNGDKWALILPNSVEYIETFHAVLWSGGVGCPINHSLKAGEIAHALLVSQPKYIIAYSKSLPRVKEAVDIVRRYHASTSKRWDKPNILSCIGKVKEYDNLEEFLDDERLPIPHYKDTSTQLASIHLSSGTTGQPKGVNLTHHNFVSNCHQLYAHDSAQFHSRSRTVAFTPFVHIAMTTMPLFLGPWCGMMHHCMPDFSLQRFGPLVSSVRPTSYQGVPSIALALANTDITTKYDFSQAEVINCGGAPMKQDLHDKLSSRAPWQVIQVYGMTEGSPYIAYQKFGEKLKVGEIGHLLPNIHAMLKLENTQEDAPRGGPGELWLAGPNICTAYTDEESNRKAFPIKGWYNTGDVCTIDANGVVSVVGRTKELIKYKGFQVSPAELEAHLNSHEEVVESGVSALWDETQLTELPTAYVVLKGLVAEGGRRKVIEKLKELHQKTNDLVSGYKKLRGGVWEVTSLPKNATGKFLRKDLGRYKTGLSSLDEVGGERASL